MTPFEARDHRPKAAFLRRLRVAMEMEAEDGARTERPDPPEMGLRVFYLVEETSLYDPPRVEVQGVARDNPYLSPILDWGFGRLKFWGPPIQNVC